MKTIARIRPILILVALIFGSSFFVRADDVKFALESSGAAKKLGYLIPMHLKLSSEKPDGIKTTPAGLEAPVYGLIKLGPVESPAKFFIIVDEPDGKPSRLFVDATGSGDFSGVSPSKWVGHPNHNGDGTAWTTYYGEAEFNVPYGSATQPLDLIFFRFDKHDPARGSVADQLFYYRDYALVGQVSLGGKNYQAMLVNDAANGDFRGGGPSAPPSRLFIDLDGDGKFEVKGESFNIGQPFDVGDATYQISGMTALGGAFQLVKTSQTAVDPAPQGGLSAGSAAIPFEATTTAGTAVNFPSGYKGKIVLLDFWATWCPPCRREIPNVVAAYQKYHARGFDVLGVSLDQADSGDALAQFANAQGMAWPEIYDGKFWSADVAVKYSINSIPHAFLVNGTTGKIIAEGDDIRGEGLDNHLATIFSR